jgi:hypothetical protein
MKLLPSHAVMSASLCMSSTWNVHTPVLEEWPWRQLETLFGISRKAHAVPQGGFGRQAGSTFQQRGGHQQRPAENYQPFGSITTANLQLLDSSRGALPFVALLPVHCCSPPCAGTSVPFQHPPCSCSCISPLTTDKHTQANATVLRC